MLSGHYTYLSYMMLSASCFFFWMMPNHHKIKAMLRPFQNRVGELVNAQQSAEGTTLKRKRANANKEDKLATKVQTRARAKLSEKSCL